MTPDADPRGGTAEVASLLHLGRTVLAEAGLENRASEARMLLAHALGATLADLLRDGRRMVPCEPFATLLRRRAAHEPMALVLGRQGFWTLDLAVSGDTLIPRADSESLIEAALLHRPERERVRRILDLGTGTGCLLLAALSEYPCAWGVGVDRSATAAALARVNAAAAGLAARVSSVCGDWGAALDPGAAGFDLVLANPPYVRSGDIAGLAPEVACHEPLSALDGGADGLAAYRRILAGLASLLAPAGLAGPPGLAVLELGAGQEPAVRALAAAAGLDHVGTTLDLGGVPRALCLARAGRVAAGR